ncbi:uncharacterized protein LOC131886800 [Tigriopus californicus]|uniref:uncharacterized protein LOC131886800 n=1 Tax=Tigriopus californicus TaxID=6832 RepID=UPI0027D9D8A9|nr:uncharacterized protein LOC131886800 [Tigriopus californicus]
MANQGSGLQPKSLEFRNDIHSFEYQYRVDQIHRVLTLVLDSRASLSLSRIRMPKLVPKPNDANIADPMTLIHVRQLVSQAADQLRHLSLPDNRYCDNETLRLIGTQCHQLQFLDVSGCSQVNDVGIQNLVFPNSVLRAGQVNLANNRIKTNPLSKYLRTLIVWDTGVSETGCVILLRFLPRLLKPAGLLKHPEMANALVRVHDRIGFERGLQVDGEFTWGWLAKCQHNLRKKNLLSRRCIELSTGGWC